jgi:hypothetical protein
VAGEQYLVKTTFRQSLANKKLTVIEAKRMEQAFAVTAGEDGGEEAPIALSIETQKQRNEPTHPQIVMRPNHKPVERKGP